MPPYTIDPPRSSDTITLLAPTVFPTTGGLYEVNLVFCCSQESDPRVPVGSGPLLRIEATSLTIGGVGTGGVVTVRPNHSYRVQLHNVPDAGYGVQFRRFGGVNAEQDVVPVGFGDPAVDWTAPDAPDGGQFHVRLVKVASGQILLDGPAVSVPVYMPTVSSPPGSGERLTPITVQGGASVRVQVSAAAHDDGDRVMLVPAGGELTQAVASDLLNRAPDVNVGGVPFYWATFTLSAAGAYDVVFVAPDGIRLATGPRITVEAPPPPPPPAAELTINGVGASGAIHVAPGAPLAVTFAHVPVDWGYSLEIYETNQCCAGSPAVLIYTIAPPQDSGTVTMTAPTAVLPGGRSYDLFLVYCCADPAEIPPEAERLALAVGPRLIVDPPAPGAAVNPTVTFTINQVGQGQELRAAAGDPLAVAISGDAAQGPLHRLDAVLLRRSEPGQPGTVRVYLDGTPTPPTSDSQPLPIWFSMAGPALDGEYDAILVQTDSGGTPVREVSGPHLVIGTGGAPAPPGTDDLYFFDTDAVGSVRQITTMTPGQRWWKDYQPFGLETGGNASTGGTADEIGFAGKEIDPSGMNYLGARYYQSQTGRFTRPDIPGIDQNLFDPQSWNLYSYVRNNPLRYVDPTGQKCENGYNAETDAFCTETIAEDLSRRAEEAWRDSQRFFLDRLLPWAANFSAGMGDALTGRMIPGVSTSVTEYVRNQMGTDSVVAKSSLTYRGGDLTGGTVGWTLAGSASATAAAIANGKYGALFGRGGKALVNQGLVRFGWYWEGPAATGRDVVGLRIGSARGTSWWSHIPFWYP